MSAHLRTREDHQIGIICALALEKAAVEGMLDDEHPGLKKMEHDVNDYTLGRIGVHNIVIACLPAGSLGNGPAATVAKDMERSFPIKFGLMVGIGGGVRSKKTDIRLGDVVISQPEWSHGGVVQWDFGRMEYRGVFRRTGSLNKPPPELLHALQSMQTKHLRRGNNLQDSLQIIARNPVMAEKFGYPGAKHDQLFEAAYDHKGEETCEGCDTQKLVERLPRTNSAPIIHYGNIASGNKVMKHGLTRDQLAKDEKVICFEMEAAGLMDNFPCLVTRGICDYADSHKNDTWQHYAATTAAAAARELLRFIDQQELIGVRLGSSSLQVSAQGGSSGTQAAASLAPNISQTAKPDEQQHVAKKLPFNVRQILREYQFNKPELERGLSSLLGIPWAIEPDLNSIYQYIKTDLDLHPLMGRIILYYFGDALSMLRARIPTNGDLKKELNEVCFNHKITLKPTEDDIVFKMDTDTICGCYIRDGNLRILFQKDKFGWSTAAALIMINNALSS